jgi:uncharacterized membrane protein YqjE
MNPSPETPERLPVDTHSTQRDDDERVPSDWREALLTLISARVTLIELESADAAKAGARRAMLLAASVLCVLFTWALLLAGGVAATSSITGCPWHWIALAAAAIHLAAAIFLGKLAKSQSQPNFPITRAEFKKDRKWIENFRKTRKSND